MTLTATERTLRARIGAHALHAKHDSRETTRAARETFLERFEREVDPAAELPLDERRRRAEAARRAYFTRLALSSARSRRRRGIAREKNDRRRVPTLPAARRSAAHVRSSG